MPAWLIQRLLQLFIIIFQKVTGITGDTRTWTEEGRKQVQEEKAKAKAKAKVVYKERQNAERNTKNFVKTITSCFNKDKFDPKFGHTGSNIEFNLIKVKRSVIDPNKYKKKDIDRGYITTKKILQNSKYDVISCRYCSLKNSLGDILYLDYEKILGPLIENTGDIKIRKFSDFKYLNMNSNKAQKGLMDLIFQTIKKKYPNVNKIDLKYVIFESDYMDTKIEDLTEIAFLVKVKSDK